MAVIVPPDPRRGAGPVPSLLEPLLFPPRVCVIGAIVYGKAGCLHDLPDKRGPAHLARTGQNLNKTTRFLHAGKQLGVEVGAFHRFYSVH